MRLLQTLLLGLCLILSTSCTQAGERPAGDWHGAILTPQGELNIVVHIADNGGTFSGTMESVDQAPGELIPLTITEANQDRLAFDVPSIKGSYAATWDNAAGA